MPISNYWQFIPFNERINFGIDNILTRQNETKYTQQGLNHHISIDTQEKLSLSDEVTDFSTQGENKILSNCYNGLADFGFNRAEQINTTYNNTQENAFFCTPLGQQEENIIPFPKIDTNEDGKVDTDTKKILEEALNLLNKEVNLTLDPTIPREKKVVCADVPAIVYEKCGIDMPSKIAEAQQKALFKIDNTTIDYLKSKNLNTKKLDFIRTLENKEYSRKELIKILQKKNFTNEEILLILDPEHTYTNKPLYKCTTVSPENDNSLTSRVANWYQFFVDKKLLHSGYEPYQVGDVIFLKDNNGNPYHSAIVTRINPKTGEPLQIVGADFSPGDDTYGKVRTYTWDQWKEDTGENSFEHGGFRS